MKYALIPIIAMFCLVVAFSRLPLLDRTESRVAVVADRIVQQGEYFRLEVPKDGHFVPYAAKPPLHYWVVAASIKLFDKSEFAVRLPSFIAGLCLLLIVPFFSGSRIVASQAILCSSVLFFYGAGIGLIDASLALALGINMLALYTWYIADRRSVLTAALIGGSAAWACALKGLLGLAIPGLIVVLFCIFARSARPLFQFPWIQSGVVFMLFSLGYYGLIEYKNPGFSQYFFLHENVLRFLTRDYGDRTGSGHAQFYGMSVAFALLAFLPWSPLLLWRLWKVRTLSERQRFLAAAAAAPAVLFLCARHHLATYQIPMLLPASLLLADLLSRRVVARISAVCMILFVGVPLVVAEQVGESYSSASLFQQAQAMKRSRLCFHEELPLSAYWYASSAIGISDATSGECMERTGALFVARKKHQSAFMRQFGEACEKADIPVVGKWHLFRCG